MKTIETTKKPTGEGATREPVLYRVVSNGIYWGSYIVSRNWNKETSIVSVG